MTRFRFPTALLLLVALPGSAAFGESRTVKLAVVASNNGPQVLNILDLGQAELSKDGRVTLLDRQTIDRVLKEQQLSLAGLVDTATAVKAGKILAADLLAVLETTGKEAVGLVVYDAATGIKYVDQTLPEGELPAVVKAVADAVGMAVKKRDQGTEGLKLLGVLAVRNADMPSGKDSLCTSLAAVLERELVNSPDVILLERRRLKTLLDETAVAPNANTKKLLASLFSLSLDFSRADGGKGIQAVAVLNDGNGKFLKSFRARSQNAAGSDLAQPLAEGIRKHLKAAEPPRAASRELESNRFVAEAVLLHSFEQDEEAYVALHAAIALNPRNIQARHQLISYLSTELSRALQANRKELKRPRVPRRYTMDGKLALHLIGKLMLALETQNDLLAEHMARPPAEVYNKVLRGTQSLSSLDGLVVRLFEYDATTMPPAWTEQRDLAQHLLFLMGKKHTHFMAEFTRQNPEMVEVYRDSIRGYMLTGHGHPADTGAYREFLRHLIGEWCASTRHPKVLAHLLQCERLQHAEAWSIPTRFLDSDTLKLLADHPHPFVAMDAGVQLLRAETGPVSGMNVARRVQVFQDAKKVYSEAFKAAAKVPDAVRRDIMKRHVYLTWHKHITDWGIGSAAMREEQKALCSFMLEQNDLIPEVLKILCPDRGFIAPTPADRWKLLGQAVTVLESSKGEKIALAPVRELLLTCRDNILRDDPTLARTNPKLAAMGKVDEPQPPWQATLLFDRTTIPRLQNLRQPFLHDGKLYCIGVFADKLPSSSRVKNLSMGLISIPLGKGNAEVLGRFSLREDDSLNAHLLQVLSSCVIGNTVYVGTRNDGIVAMPLSGGPGSGLPLDLPSPEVGAMTALGQTLFAYLHGGYLVEIDPRASSFTTLASSRRKDNRSPFDDREPFTIPFLAAGPERNRILFIAQRLRIPGERLKFVNPDQGFAGLWQYDPQARAFTRLLKSHDSPNQNGFQSGTLQRDGNLLIQCPFAVLEFSVADDKATLLHCTRQSPVPTIDVSTAILRDPYPLYGPRELKHNNWLWGILGSQVDRLSLTGRYERYPILAGRTQNLATRTAYVESVDSDTLIVGGCEGFAILKLDPESNP